MAVKDHPGNVYKIYKIFSLVLVCGNPSINGSLLPLSLRVTKMYTYQYMIINYWVFKKTTIIMLRYIVTFVIMEWTLKAVVILVGEGFLSTAVVLF